jgi:opacity protein-like surface antigen
MKKLLVFLLLLPMLAGLARAQDEGARQDINLSFMGVIQPYITSHSTPVVKQNSTLGGGLYLGYRYLLTPNNAVEANYSYSHFTNKFINSSANARVRTGLQEATAAYVRTIPFRRWNPFLEIGGGMVFFTPIPQKTTTYDTHQTSELTVLFGAGIAYELSPSWDLRVQYRAQYLNPSNFGLTNSPNDFKIDRRYWVSQPAVGFAYHF